MTRRTQPERLVIDDATPGRLLAVADLCVGDSVLQVVRFDQDLREAFGRVANDGAPVHADPAFARARGFEAPIIQGLCVTTRFSRLIGMYLPGQSAVVESLSFKFRRPVYQDQAVEFTAVVARVMAPLRVVRLNLRAAVAGTTCVVGEAQCLVR